MAMNGLGQQVKADLQIRPFFTTTLRFFFWGGGGWGFGPVVAEREVPC